MFDHEGQARGNLHPVTPNDQMPWHRTRLDCKLIIQRYHDEINTDLSINSALSVNSFNT